MASTDTILAGLFGHGISGSRARQMHEREAAAQGIVLVYRVVDFAKPSFADRSLGDMLAVAADIGFAGLNITHPFKQAVIEHLDELSDEAAALGAVNTVKFADGRRIGHNTDWSGFAASVEQHLGHPARGKVGQIGAGGAGSAIAFSLLHSGVSTLSIFDPDISKAKALADRMQYMFPDRQVFATARVEQALANVDGVTQTSPVGMTGHPGLPFDPALLHAGQWLSDIVYFPAETELVMQARRNGVTAFGGSAMAVHQAAKAFEIFTGKVADPARMLRELSFAHP